MFVPLEMLFLMFAAQMEGKVSWRRRKVFTDPVQVGTRLALAPQMRRGKQKAGICAANQVQSAWGQPGPGGENAAQIKEEASWRRICGLPPGSGP